MSKLGKFDRDPKGGLWIGIQFATGYSLIALLILALSGELGTRYGWTVFGRYGLVYFTAGIIGGLVYGLLKPITNRRWGLMFFLAIVGVVIYTLGMYTYLDLHHYQSELGLWVITVVVGIGFGIGAGDKIWEKRSK